MAVAVIQAFFGWYHHHRYIRDKSSKRRWSTHVHLRLGRILILCGMVNCGFGLLAAGRPFSDAIIWWTGCGILAGIYFAFSPILVFIRRRQTGKHTGVAYGRAPMPGGYELNPYEGSRVNLINNAAVPGLATAYTPPTAGEIPGRYEPDPYDAGKGYMDRD